MSKAADPTNEVDELLAAFHKRLSGLCRKLFGLPKSTPAPWLGTDVATASRGVTA